MNDFTVGMLTYDDFDGVYFSIQSLRLHHPEVAGRLRFVIVDNNPSSAHGKAVEGFSKWVKQPIKYVTHTSRSSTSLRNLVFDHADTENVLCIDCHVLLAPGSLQALISHMEANRNGDLIQGPMLMDNLSSAMTHMEPVWRDGMFGIWAEDNRAKAGDPFGIPSMGLGAFACRKDSWLRFNEKFRGFGGEEGYIHDKFRAHGRRTICLPQFQWLHRFQRPAGVPYPLKWEDRVFNYCLGKLELGQDVAPVIEHFSTKLSQATLDRCLAEAIAAHAA